jgi:hypothetical protein
MTDIVERAEKFVALDHRVTNFVGAVPIINDLVAEVKRLRRKVRELELTISEEVAHLSADQRAELAELRSDPDLT